MFRASPQEASATRHKVVSEGLQDLERLANEARDARRSAEASLTCGSVEQLAELATKRVHQPLERRASALEELLVELAVPPPASMTQLRADLAELSALSRSAEVVAAVVEMKRRVAAADRERRTRAKAWLGTLRQRLSA